MAIAYKSSDLNEAHIVCGLLNVNGINAHVGGHYLQGGVGELSSTDFAMVHVNEEDLLQATSVIAEYDGTHQEPEKHAPPVSNLKTKMLVFIVSLLLIILLFTIL